MFDKYRSLIQISEQIMSSTRDPIHDLAHARRVAQNAVKLGRELNLSERQLKIVTLAAHWHDVSRTLNRRPSFIIMPFFDDVISAGLMLGYIFKNSLISSTALSAAKVILCKSLGTGAILTHLLMRRQNRVMVNVLKDADTLDMLNHERIKQVLILSQSSNLYHLGYKTMIWWFTNTHHLYMATKEGRDYMISQLSKFKEWLREKEIFNWHVEMYGLVWVETNLSKLESLIERLNLISSPIAS